MCFYHLSNESFFYSSSIDVHGQSPFCYPNSFGDLLSNSGPLFHARLMIVDCYRLLSELPIT